MQSLFTTYLELGFTHILDPQAYDHLLFLVALCAPYRVGNWRSLLLLATAFTIGHSLTLALVGLSIVLLPTAWIEFFIPVTILLTVLWHLYRAGRHPEPPRSVGAPLYLLVLLFGLIHGAGFSTLFRATALPDEAGQVWQQLLAFNLGVELGQLVIIGGILLVSYVALSLLRLPYRWWLWLLSAAAMLVSLRLMLDTYPL